MNKRTLLLLCALAALLAISGFAYQKYDEYRRSGGKKAYSPHAAQQEEDAGEDRDGPPVIKKARFQIESADNTDRIRLIIEGNRNDTKTVQYRYEWFRNGSAVGGNEDSVTGFKKGDRIEVKVTPFDDKRYGQPRLLSFTIARVPLKIVENATASFDGDVLSCQVKAIDPDGGALTYSLMNAPEGMTIDSATGMIKWRVKTRDRGKYSVSVMIKNADGAQLIYPVSLDLDKADE